MNQNKPHYVDINKITLRLPAYKDDDGEVYVPVSDVRRIIAEAREENVQEVMHRRWISNELGGYKWAYYCSGCGWVDRYPFNDRHKYCPNCGAKMDGKE